MKIAYDGTRYDTENGTVIGSADWGSSLDGWTATLYRTPRAGRYFLCGSGGMMTLFRGRDRIIPLTDDEAFQWAKRYLANVRRK